MSLKNIIKRIKEPAPEYFYEEIPAIWAKKYSLELHLKEINTLFLGSSHLDCCFESGYIDKAFNLALKSCDLYYMYSLYKKYAPLMPELKNVIIFYSPFHYGWDLSKSLNFYHYIVFFKKIFGIQYRYKLDFLLKFKEIMQSEKINKIILSTDKKLLNNSDGNLNGYHYLEATEEDFIKLDTLISHIKESVRNSNNSKFIEKTEEIAKRYKHNTVYVLPPCHYLYRSMMPDKKILFREIYKLKEKYNVKVIDMYEADIGSKSSYGDSDHLSRLGGGNFYVQICA